MPFSTVVYSLFLELCLVYIVVNCFFRRQIIAIFFIKLDKLSNQDPSVQQYGFDIKSFLIMAVFVNFVDLNKLIGTKGCSLSAVRAVSLLGALAPVGYK